MWEGHRRSRGADGPAEACDVDADEDLNFRAQKKSANNLGWGLVREFRLNTLKETMAWFQDGACIGKVYVNASETLRKLFDSSLDHTYVEIPYAVDGTTAGILKLRAVDVKEMTALNEAHANAVKERTFELTEFLKTLSEVEANRLKIEVLTMLKAPKPPSPPDPPAPEDPKFRRKFPNGTKMSAVRETLRRQKDVRYELTGTVGLLEHIGDGADVCKWPKSDVRAVQEHISKNASPIKEDDEGNTTGVTNEHWKAWDRSPEANAAYAKRMAWASCQSLCSCIQQENPSKECEEMLQENPAKECTKDTLATRTSKELEEIEPHIRFLELFCTLRDDDAYSLARQWDQDVAHGFESRLTVRAVDADAAAEQLNVNWDAHPRSRVESDHGPQVRATGFTGRLFG